MPVTFGTAGPSQVTLNLDSLFGTTLAAYNKTLIDNIGNTNAFFHEIIKGDMYQSQDGGAYIQTPLMYQLAPADSYDGYDTLSTLPVDGITDAIAQWRQVAVPIAYSMKEVKMNKQRIVDLVKSRIRQAELGIQEYWAAAFEWGTSDTGGSVDVARTSAMNGSTSIDPIGLLVKYDPTTSTTIDNINQQTYTWWQNKTKTSAATTYNQLLLEYNNAFHSAALGTGGKPNLVIMDQVSYELFVQALYQAYRAVNTDNNYPFENTTYKGAHVVFDEKIPDVFSNVNNTTTWGTAYMLNTQFMKVMYESESNFQMLKDEAGKTFQKPIGGDSRVGHIGWMGNTMITNRRKQMVLGKIARTLS